MEVEQRSILPSDELEDVFSMRCVESKALNRAPRGRDLRRLVQEA